MGDFTLSAEEIKNNWITLMGLIKKSFSNNPKRVEKLIDMYEDMQDTIMFSPASSYEHLHNAIHGGYVDHVIRVMKFSVKFYKTYKEIGMDVSNFEIQELLFAALNHDLGKIGFPGEDNSGYIPETSKWWKENRGRHFTINPNIPFGLVPDKSLYLLQRYGIECSWNEFLGIRIHDGPYDSANEPYYNTFKPEANLRNNLPYILHTADMAASRYEWERWIKHSNKIDTSRVDTVVTSNKEETKLEKPKNENINELGNFSDVFKE